VKGQGLARMLTESNQEAIQMGENEQVNVAVSELEHDEWYSDIIYYLKNLSCPDHLVDYKRRALRLKAMKYCLTENGLRWKDPDEVLFRCVNKEEANKILKELHLSHSFNMMLGSKGGTTKVFGALLFYFLFSMFS
jgi:hypothetical protein